MTSLVLLLALAAQPAPAAAQPGSPPAAAAATAARFTLDTPIETIAADPRGKAVLDKIFPDMLGRPEYPDFKSMSLSQVQPMANGAITDADLKRAQAELAAIK